MLAEILFFGILIYLAYKVVFDFIVPVSHASKQMKQQFRNMQEHAQQANQFQQQNRQQNNPQQKSKEVVGDYIDFEEVKK
ncbi:MAG: hypothetical protein ABUT20_39635 [Bacteroidota bacterium]